MKIRPGARIQTVGQSQLDIGVVDKYELRIKEKSDVIAGSLAFNTSTRRLNSEFSIQEGSIYNRIHEDYLGTFEIDSPNVLVTAIGTEYALDVWGPQQQSWVGSAVGPLEAVDKFDNITVNIPARHKLDIGADEDESGQVTSMPDFELQGLRRELDKIGTGVDEDLDVRAYFILSYSATRVKEFLDGAAIITNTNEPRKLQSLVIPTVRMLPNRVNQAAKIIKNVAKIIFVCNFYADPRFTPHFLSLAGVIYHMVGEDKEAVKVFNQVLGDYPDFMYASVVQCAIAVIHEVFLDQPKKALAAYRKILQDYPTSIEVKMGEAGVKRLGG